MCKRPCSFLWRRGNRRHRRSAPKEAGTRSGTLQNPQNGARNGWNVCWTASGRSSGAQEHCATDSCVQNGRNALRTEEPAFRTAERASEQAERASEQAERASERVERAFRTAETGFCGAPYPCATESWRDTLDVWNGTRPDTLVAVCWDASGHVLRVMPDTLKALWNRRRPVFFSDLQSMIPTSFLVGFSRSICRF